MLRDITLNIAEPRVAKRLPSTGAALPSRLAPSRRVMEADVLCDQRLLSGLMGNEIRAYFQPKVDLTSMSVTGLEVLARWEPQPGRIISPAIFLPAIKRIGALDMMLFRLVEQATGLMRGMGRPDIGLAFNISPVQLASPSFAHRFLGVLRACRYGPENITMEITEDCPILDIHLCGRLFGDLKRAGCRLSMDDYGKGYSSLSRLVHLPFEEIKLDGSFIGMGTYCMPIVQHSLALARSLNLSLVVEGVEHVEQHEQLVALGCPLAQGYAYGMPVGADGVSALLSRWGARR